MHHIEGKDNKTFRNHLILSRYLTEKMTRRAEKVASRALFNSSEGKNERSKMQVMRQKCAFSTLISAGKVKRIDRKKNKNRRNSEYTERKKQDKQEGKELRV